MDQRGEAEEDGRHSARRSIVERFWIRAPTSVTRGNVDQNLDDNNPLNIIRRAFQSLSKEDQEKARQNKCGGEEPTEETDAFIREKLQELETEINLLGDKTKSAYMEAIQQEIEHEAAAIVAAAVERQVRSDRHMIHGKADQLEKEDKSMINCKEFRSKHVDDQVIASRKDNVRSKSFRLMFLRAELFNARMAARRIVRYFKEKKELFGVENLSRRIKQEDLNELERNMLSSGCLCSTGATDTYGRIIIYFCRRMWDEVPVDALRRVAFYTFQILAEDHVEWQRKGLISVVDGRGVGLPQPLLERRLYPFHRTIIHALPLRNAYWNVCYDDAAFHFFLKIALVVVPTKLRTIIQTNYGKTAQEMFAGLSECGIDLEDLPLTKELQFHKEPVDNFLNDLRQKEEASKEFPDWLTKELLQWL